MSKVQNNMAMTFANMLFVCIAMLFSSCTEVSENDEPQVETKADCEVAISPDFWDNSGLSVDSMYLIMSLFSEENKDMIITTRYDIDEKTGEYIVTSRFESKYEILRKLPNLKSRAEADDNQWIYWGDICGVGAASKFARFLEEKFKGVPYETRFEPIDGSGCRKAYYRKG